jgi:hypothetical protein
MLLNFVGYLLHVVGLVLGFIGALLLTLAEIKTKKEIEAESATCWDKNSAVEKGLRQKSLLAIISTMILAFGFGLQLIGLALS